MATFVHNYFVCCLFVCLLFLLSAAYYWAIKLLDTPTGTPLTGGGGVECSRGFKKSRFSANLSLYLRNDKRQSHSYYGMRIGNRSQAFEQWRTQRGPGGLAPVAPSKKN